MNVNMLHSLPRFCFARTAYTRVSTRLYNSNAYQEKEKQVDEQVEHLKYLLENKKSSPNWTVIKTDVLARPGNFSERNIDAVMLKYMTGLKNYEAGLSFINHLKSVKEELSLGTINGILGLYNEIGKSGKLSKEQKQYILDTHKNLLAKYKYLDSSTCERLLHALCIIDEWEKAVKLLADIHVTNVPSHSAYSTLIATFFRLNKKKKAIELIEESLKYKRPLLENAYEEWINYILRKYKDKKTIAKYFDELFSHVAANGASVPMHTAEKLKEVYSSLDWNAQFTRIKKMDGTCSCCKDNLVLQSLTDEEFNKLQQNIKDKLIVGSDLFLKTSPEELKSFLDFVERTAPYDIVLDGLNIAYAIGKSTHFDKLNALNKVVDHFVKQNKKILLLGRQHMLRWHQRTLQQIKSKTCSFFTENLSQDDPYFITAAILSGPQTDIVSKDLLRGHMFLLKDESLQLLFKKWQYQHQWMVFQNNQKGINIQPPLKFTPFAQKKNNTWHVPFQRDIIKTNEVNDGVPDLYSWLCLRQ